MAIRNFATLTLALLCTLFVIPAASAQKKPGEEKGAETIKWMTFEEAVKLNSKKPKMIFVDIYTDWCGWCKKMDSETFSNPEVVAYMNKKYYAVKLNAEQKGPINFKEQVFVNASPEKPKSTHGLALALLKNEKLYPSYVILDKSSDWTYKLKGYKTPDELIPILSYYTDENYLKMSWSEFLSANK
ncbi:MAG: thioredoxin family protein [Lentimicrobium sp.]